MTTTQKACSSLLLPSLSPSHCLLTSPSKTSATPPIHHWDTQEASFLSSSCPYIYIYIHTYVLIYHAPPTSVGTYPSSAGGNWRMKTGNIPCHHSLWHSQAPTAVGDFSTAMRDKFEGGFPVQWSEQGHLSKKPPHASKQNKEPSGQTCRDWLG